MNQSNISRSQTVKSEEIIREIIDDVYLIRETLVKENISRSTFGLYRTRLEKASEPELLMAQGFLLDFKERLFNEYLRIKKLIPELTWQLYKLSGKKGCTFEELELIDILSRIKDRWKERPHILTRNSNNLDKVNYESHDPRTVRKTGKPSRKPSRKAKKAGRSN